MDGDGRRGAHTNCEVGSNKMFETAKKWLGLEKAEVNKFYTVLWGDIKNPFFETNPKPDVRVVDIKNGFVLYNFLPEVCFVCALKNMCKNCKIVR
jgi:hypothetical protein